MMHKLLSFVLPLLAPTIGYFIYVVLKQRRAAEVAAGHPIEGWRGWPWVSLLTWGLGLAIVATFALSHLTSDPDRGTYVPPHMEDGKLVPGEFITKESSDTADQ